MEKYCFKNRIAACLDKLNHRIINMRCFLFIPLFANHLHLTASILVILVLNLIVYGFCGGSPLVRNSSHLEDYLLNGHPVGPPAL